MGKTITDTFDDYIYYNIYNVVTDNNPPYICPNFSKISNPILALPVPKEIFLLAINILISIMGNFTLIHDVREAQFSNQNNATYEF